MLSLRTSAKEAATKYDKMSDELIIGGIRSVFPKHSILTEESGLLQGDREWLWIVDSLDGTGDFANWNPLFSVCLALMHKGELVLGVVYAPAIDEFYLAERGSGAYLNGKRIRVSSTADLQQSYLFYCEGGERDRQRTGAALGGGLPEGGGHTQARFGRSGDGLGGGGKGRSVLHDEDRALGCGGGSAARAGGGRKSHGPAGWGMDRGEG